MIGYSSTFMDKIIERADKRQERMEKMIGKMLDKSEKILQAGMTEEQFIRTQSTKDLAVMLVTIALYPMEFKPYKEYLKICADGATEKDFVDITKKWLRSKHQC